MGDCRALGLHIDEGYPLTLNGIHPRQQFQNGIITRSPIKMLNRLQPLEKEQLANLHNACMRILSKVGVVFHDAEALEIFKKHGFKVDGKKGLWLPN